MQIIFKRSIRKTLWLSDETLGNERLSLLFFVLCECTVGLYRHLLATAFISQSNAVGAEPLHSKNRREYEQIVFREKGGKK